MSKKCKNVKKFGLKNGALNFWQMKQIMYKDSKYYAKKWVLQGYHFGYA